MFSIPRFVRSRSTLWSHRDFFRFWLADTSSWIGSQVTQLALPLLAAITLDASPFEVGLLAAVGQAPMILIGLFAGAWIERRRRRPILISADLGRAALMAVVPIAAIGGWLSMPLLYVVAFAAGICTVLFDISYLSFVPTLVGRDRLVEANSKLEASASAAQVAGPFLGGILVGLFTAPFAIAIDAVSYLDLGALPAPDRHRGARAGAGSAPADLRQISDGIGYVVHEPTLRALAGCQAVTNLAGWAFLAVYVLYHGTRPRPELDRDWPRLRRRRGRCADRVPPGGACRQAVRHRLDAYWRAVRLWCYRIAGAARRS